MKIVFTLVIWLLPLLWTPLRAKLDASTASARLLDANFRLRQLKGIWSESKEDEGPLNASEVKILREEAWEMFDHGYSNYMRHAFPLDNLLPVSCRGEDWQGGLGLTLIDALDTLLLMNRTEDIRIAVDLMEKSINFDKDVKVHVFETVIRGLGGLLSGHVAIRTTLTCHSCAGTLLMEFGMLSALTGRPSTEAANEWRRAMFELPLAPPEAFAMFELRCTLGLVGSILDAMFELRSPLGLVGSSLDAHNLISSPCLKLIPCPDYPGPIMLSPHAAHNQASRTRMLKLYACSALIAVPHVHARSSLASSFDEPRPYATGPHQLMGCSSSSSFPYYALMPHGHNTCSSLGELSGVVPSNTPLLRLKLMAPCPYVPQATSGSFAHGGAQLQPMPECAEAHNHHSSPGTAQLRALMP
eukprot:gene18664-25181_t